MSYSEEFVREKVEKLYKTNRKIHITILSARGRAGVDRAEAMISGVYPHLFGTVEHSAGFARRHSISYSELISGQVMIEELELPK